MACFVSDNAAGAHPAIIEAVTVANVGDARPYGDDALSGKLDAAFSEVFEKEVAVIPCVSGTAANALALSLVAGPTSAICAHAGSHVYADECNAPEFFTGGARLTPVGGEYGKLDRDELLTAVSRQGDRHAAQPAAVTAAQATETGVAYTLDELAGLGAFAHRHGLALHMDGARFANALVHLDCRPAEMTWQAGVDVLSFGATKNGCLGAEAVVLFDVAQAHEARFRAKRSGQLLSKMRFVAAQLLAYLGDDLWLSNARAANRATRRLYQGLLHHPDVAIDTEPGANMLFARFPPDLVERLDQAGMAGYVDDTGTMRLCTSWRTTLDDVDRLLTTLGTSSAAAAKDGPSRPGTTV